jgi:hypothetical protein
MNYVNNSTVSKQIKVHEDRSKLRFTDSVTCEVTFPQKDELLTEKMYENMKGTGAMVWDYLCLNGYVNTQEIYDYANDKKVVLITINVQKIPPEEKT